MVSRMVLLRAAALRPRATAVGASLLRSSFSQSRSIGLKESSGHDGNGARHEEHKQDSLAKQKQGKGHWKPELASDSEESVKADRQGHADGSGEASIKKLQEKTKHHAEQTSKAGTSTHDGL